MPGKSKKAFSKNVATEMNAGKPQPQALAIAYGMKRRAPKKMAEGGAVSAANEARPMPAKRYNDSRDLATQATPVQPGNSKWTDAPMGEKRPKYQATKPMIRKGATFSTGTPDDMEQMALKKREAALQALKPAAPTEQPPEEDNELEPNRTGTKPHPMKMMASGGKVSMEIGSGPEEDEEENPAGLESDDDEMAPAVDEYMANKFADGGMVDDDDQPEDEEEEENHASVASAIMARQKYADGGMVDIDENAEEQPNGYYARNEDAALKENYDSDMDGVSEPDDSNEHGDVLSDEDAHDMISRIMARMKRKSPISK